MFNLLLYTLKIYSDRIWTSTLTSPLYEKQSSGRIKPSPTKLEVELQCQTGDALRSLINIVKNKNIGHIHLFFSPI